MDAECDNCRIWAHAKCEMITKQEYKAGFLTPVYAQTFWPNLEAW